MTLFQGPHSLLPTHSASWSMLHITKLEIRSDPGRTEIIDQQKHFLIGHFCTLKISNGQKAHHLA